jgi:hypothetical protein
MTTNNLNKPDLMAEDELEFLLDEILGQNYVETNEGTLLTSEIAEKLNAYTTNKINEATKEGYDVNRLGSWVFIGDNARLQNLDDLYWSYVVEFCAAEDPYRPDSQFGDIEWCKRQMPYASFSGVGQFKMMAIADQSAKERLALNHRKER